MQIHLYDDDLVHDYDGKPEKAELSDFPALGDIYLTPFDCVVFHWGKEQKILLSPVEKIKFEPDEVMLVDSKGYLYNPK